MNQKNIIFKKNGEKLKFALDIYFKYPNSLVKIISSDSEYILILPTDLDKIEEEFPYLLLKINSEIYNL